MRENEDENERSMKTQFLYGALLAGAGLWAAALPAFGQASTTPAYDHVVVVMLENHGYDQILNYGTDPTVGLPYINGMLRPNSADMTQAYGVQHPSQPNYYWTLSGSNQGLLDDTPATAGGFAAPNLAGSLQAQGKSFIGYALGLPSNGSTVDEATEPNGNTYVRRHVPWTGFQNEDGPTVNQTFDGFASMVASGNFSALPTVSFVIPDLEDDMHNFPQGNAVGNATQAQDAAHMSDAWLQANIEPYRQWALTHNSLLILTFDEDSTADWVTTPPGFENPDGLTNPGNTTIPGEQDQITMLFSGADVVDGQYAEGQGVTNVNLLRTIESFYNIAPEGAQQGNATVYGIGNGPITDIFTTVPEPAAGAGLLGAATLMLAGWRRWAGARLARGEVD